MKYYLDDLLKQAYGQPETPSEDFCQTVILEMKKRKVVMPFWKKRGTYYGIALAAACSGIMILAGFGIQILRQEKLQNPDMPIRQEIAEKEKQVPMETEHPVDREDQVETEKQIDRKEETENGRPQDVLQENGKEGGKHRNASGQGEVPGGDAASPQNRGEAKEMADSFSGNSDSRRKIIESGTSVPSGENNTEQDGGSHPKKPQSADSLDPGVSPEVPVPSDAVFPQENYMSLCSVESFSFTPISPNSSAPPDGMLFVADVTGVWGEIFQDRLIHSYEELQILTGEIQEKLGQEQDAHVQKILQYLKQYQPDDFVSDALCMDVIMKRAELELELNTVYLEGKREGKKCLNIQFGSTSGETDSKDLWQYSVSMVRVSQKIARQCDRVRFWYS